MFGIRNADKNNANHGRRPCSLRPKCWKETRPIARMWRLRWNVIRRVPPTSDFTTSVTRRRSWSPPEFRRKSSLRCSACQRRVHLECVLSRAPPHTGFRRSEGGKVADRPTAEEINRGRQIWHTIGTPTPFRLGPRTLQLIDSIGERGRNRTYNLLIKSRCN
jgi:hypothetical protein